MEHITSLKNPKVAAWKALKDRKGRRESGCFLVEGRKMVEEALKSAFDVEAVLVQEGVSFPDGLTMPVYELPEHVLAAVCDTKTPQGIAAVVRMKEQSALGKHIVVLDGVQDPGNVGTLWRTADAFGADGMILLPGCADPWSPKTLRATMGACFRLPVWEGALGDLVPKLAQAGLPLYATALREDTVDLREMDLRRCAIAIGSEGRGVSQAVLDASAKTVKIPMAEQCESLNAAIAGAVVLWQMGFGR